MVGKAIGEFSLKAITATYSPGPAGGVLNQVKGLRPDLEPSLGPRRSLAAAGRNLQLVW